MRCQFILKSCLRKQFGSGLILQYFEVRAITTSHGFHTMMNSNKFDNVRKRTQIYETRFCAPQNLCPASPCLDVTRRSYYKDSLYYKCFSSETSVPIIYTQKLLEIIQTSTGLPWWATIMGTTILLKATVTMPVAVYSQNIASKLALLRPEIREISERWKRQISIDQLKNQWTPAKAKKEFMTEMKTEIKSLYKRDDCHPLKSTAVFWVQLPLWITISVTLRNMTGTFIGHVDGLVPGLMTGGVAWFPNLVLIDPLSLMPLMLGVFNLINIELSTPKQAPTSRLFNVMTHVSKVLSVLMVLFSAMLPSGVTLYWTTSAGYGLAQNILLKSPAFRRLVRIPRTPLEDQRPFRDMLDGFLKLLSGKDRGK